jgi:thioester reductase-like protein
MSSLKDKINSTFDVYQDKNFFHFLENDGSRVSYTYSQLKKESQQFIQKNKLNQFPAGSQIGLLSENSPEWIIAFLAIVEANLIPVLLDSGLTGIEIKQQMDIVSLRGMFHSAAQIGKNIPEVQENNSFIKLTPKEDDNEDLDDVVVILFTSGTESVFKAVKITNQSILFRLAVSIEFIDYDVLASILPFQHVYGLMMSFLLNLINGKELCFMRNVTPENLFRILHEDHPDGLVCVPRLLEMINKKILNSVEELPYFKKQMVYFLQTMSQQFYSYFHVNIGKLFFKKIYKSFGGKLRIFYTGGSALEEKIFKSLVGFGFNITEGYGLTETVGMVCANKFDSAVLGSVGKPIGCEAKIFFDDDEGVGELCFRGPGLFKGYYGNDNSPFDVNDWYRTGDAATIDRKGNIYIKSRIKEVIVTAGGKKVHPLAVASYYKSIPHVFDMAIVGVPLKSGGTDKIFCVIQIQPEIEIPKQKIEEDIKKIIHERSKVVPHHFRVEQIYFVDKIQKTTSLKVKRKILIQEIMASHEQTFKPQESANQYPEEHTVTKITNVISKVLNISPQSMNPNVPLSEYGIDSLMAMHIHNEISRVLNQIIPTEKLFSNPTIAEFAAWIDQGVSSEETIANTKRASADMNTFTPEIMNTLKTNVAFLTGATGVLGGELVKELLRSGVTVYCLIRGKSYQEAHKKLVEILDVYHEALESKQLVIVVGDIDKPFFGLSESEYLILANKVDFVIHDAAKTSLHGDYDELKQSNVLGTQKVIDFALKTAQKMLLHVSSYSIMGDIQFQNKEPFTENDFDRMQGFTRLGYQQSKFEAELLVREASAQGLKWIIARPGNIFGDSNDGSYPLTIPRLTGLYYDILKTVIETKKAYDSDVFFDIVPVDYVAKAMVFACINRKEVFRVYHLVNPDVKRYSELMHLLQNIGYPLEIIPKQEYLSLLMQGELKRDDKEYISVTTELLKFNPVIVQNDESTYASAKLTQDILKEAGIICPPIDESLMRIYLDYAKKVGYL